MSIYKLYLTLKSQGIKVSKNTLYNYLSMLEDSMFAFFVPRFTNSIRKKNLSINKIYIADIGYTKLIENSDNKGNKLENIVFLELERRKEVLTTIYYWKSQQQEYEVDFVIAKRGKIEQLIQVCYDLQDISVKNRELSALVKASKELKCKNLLVITYDYENRERISGEIINFIPAWKWLLAKTIVKNKHKIY